ncbi:MAG TPA: LPS export ABC transporter periplasmic protein LptC [Candidatus Acidoferrales bacterium]|nr:LPS export ABC transporter periplasmic protein LptC [Candidatus Acidoferrales bacterium]
MSARRSAALIVAALLLGVVAPARAQFSTFGAFDTVHTNALQSNERTGDFTIPGRFTATRQGTEIEGDRAQGNAATKQVEIDGNVVVHFTRPLQIVGEPPSSAQGPSTLTCDQLQIDGAHQVYHAIGNVHFTQNTRETTSDRADLDGATDQLRLSGRIAIRETGGSHSGVGGFDTIQAAAIDSNPVTGNFTIPDRFTATREGLQITGDRATGNSVTKRVSITGNVVVVLESVPVNGPSPSPVPSPTATPMPPTLTCDRLDIDGVHRVYHAIGDVHYQEPGRDITADRADISEVHTHLHLQGNVHVTETEQSGAS